MFGVGVIVISRRDLRGLTLRLAETYNQPFTPGETGRDRSVSERTHEDSRIPGQADPPRGGRGRAARASWPTRPQAAADAFVKLAGPVAVVKAQIHAGGRGKGTIKDNPEQRGVQLVRSREEAETVAANMLGHTLVTMQTGPEGKTVHRVLVEEGLHDRPRAVPGRRSSIAAAAGRC